MAYRNYSTAVSHIVDATGQGDFTTIAAALTAAVSGQTIFVRPGTYTENPTLVAGVDIAAFPGEGFTGNVIINGNCTLSTAGTVTISGIQLKTNSAALLTVSGSVASIVNLVGCYLNCLNNTGITYSSSSASSQINLFQCNANLGTTGITLFSHSSAGTMLIEDGQFQNSGSSTTVSTVSGSGALQLFYVNFNFGITTSSTASINIYNSQIQPGGLNVIALTVGGTGNSVAYFSYFASGTASAISVSVSCTLTAHHCTFNSTNTNALTGAGTLTTVAATFNNTSHLNNLTTTTGSGAINGLTNGVAPAAGMVGEQIRGFQASAGISVSTGTPTTVTSIALTPGIWDVSAMATTAGNPTVGTLYTIGITTATNAFTGSTAGDSQATTSFVSAAISGQTLVIPAFRITISAGATYYLVTQMNYTAGAATVYGRLSGTRVG